MSKPSKSWDFTINNYTEGDVKLLQSWEPEVNGLFVSEETGKEGTPHLQCRVIFKRAYRLKQLKKLHPKAHWETTKCGKDNLYLLKEGSNMIIRVDNRAQGRRSDLQEVVEKIKNGDTIQSLWTDHTSTMIRYHKGIELAAKHLAPVHTTSNHSLESFPSTWPLRGDSICVIYWGETGIGKTEFALAQFKKPLMVRHIDDLGQLEPTVHDGIVFDDMSFRHMPRTAQIHLIDARSSSIHIRYTTATIPDKFPRIFTTNDYGGAIVDLEDPAIKRRVAVYELEQFNKD